MPAVSDASAESPATRAAGACRLCGSPSRHRFTATDRNRRTTTERFEYRECERCGTLFVAEIPPDVGRFYPGDYFTLPALAQLDAVARNEAYKLQALQQHAPAGRVVEIGPGFGAFCRQAKLAGRHVTALEMDGACCAHLRAVVGVEAIETDVPEQALAALEPSAAIAAWHALEHLPDPLAVIEAAAANLAPAGVLIVAVPNPQALQLRILGGRWAHVDAPRHLHLIPARTLAEHGRAAGLEQVALTSDDGGARHWNAFGWGRAVLPPAPSPRVSHAGEYIGRAVAALAAPWERRPLCGSAYTLVLRKPR